MWVGSHWSHAETLKVHAFDDVRARGEGAIAFGGQTPR